MNEKINEILKKINNIRFGTEDGLIRYDDPQNQVYDYVYSDFKNEQFFGREATVKGVCDLCKDIENKNGFELKIVSHGIHSLDLFKKQSFDNYSEYRDDGVMLIFESPSNNIEACYKKDAESEKYPAKVWWWLDYHGTNKKATYPEYFKCKQYGELFNSIVHTFKLKNAYMTNLIKCGLLIKEENKEEKFGQFDSFHEDCKENCFRNILLKELEIIKPKLILAFSSNVNYYLKNHMQKILEVLPENQKPVIVQVPHPAHQNLSNEYFRTLWYCRILEGLIKSKIITDEVEKNDYWNNYISEPVDYFAYLPDRPRVRKLIIKDKRPENVETKIVIALRYDSEKMDYEEHIEKGKELFEEKKEQYKKQINDFTNWL